MAQVTSRITIRAPAEWVFKTITNPREAVRLIPGGVRVTHVPRLPLVRGSEVRWEFILLGVPLRGKWTVDELNSPTFYLARTSGGVNGRLLYTILPRGSSCRLTFDFDYQVPQSVIRRFAFSFVEPHVQRIIDGYLLSLKAFVEQRVLGKKPK
ncbi:MAG: SRPBCC family protein [Candidatus Kerfeldbacteria bacterium]|nr:SRPBCC family protein [Candidatus Kerfeldbacteria bacterium]